MYCLQIRDGDLVLDGGGNVATVSTSERIKQDLACWLMEPLGTDFGYPSFGSSIHDFIGTPMWESTRSRIASEVGRVVSNYIAYQRGIYDDHITHGDDLLAIYSLGDILSGEYSVQVTGETDTIRVRVSVRTEGGQSIEIDEVY